MRTFLTASLAVSLLAAPALAQTKAGDITVTDAWTRSTKGPMGAGFLTLTNTGAAEDTLTKVEAAWAERAEIHDHIRDENGVMKMREIEALAIPAGQAVELRPMGKHLMFFGVKEALAQGEMRPVTLTFAKAGAVTLDLPVQPPGSMGPGKAAGGHEGHGGMHQHQGQHQGIGADGKPQRGTAPPPPGATP
jgi:copper(I)-binding protein